MTVNPFIVSVHFRSSYYIAINKGEAVIGINECTVTIYLGITVLCWAVYWRGNTMKE